MADSLVSRFGCYTIIWDVTLQSPRFLHAAPASRFASIAMTFALSGATAKRSRRIWSGPSG